MLPPLLQSFFNYKAAIFSAVITLFGIANFQSIREKKTWPQYDATIVTSAATADPSDSQKAILSFNYRYEIEAKRISSSRVFASTFRSDLKFRDEVEAVASRFPVGSSAMAYVNPDDIYDSYLDLTPAMIDYVILGLGAAGVLIFFTHSFTERRKSSQTE